MNTLREYVITSAATGLGQAGVAHATRHHQQPVQLGPPCLQQGLRLGHIDRLSRLGPRHGPSDLARVQGHDCLLVLAVQRATQY